MTKFFFTYILLCSDNSYYVGVSNDPVKRVDQHNSGNEPNSYCHSRRPVRLMFLRPFYKAGEAISYEKQVKRWSRKKKEALIFGRIDELHDLAACKNSTSHKFYKKPGTEE